MPFNLFRKKKQPEQEKPAVPPQEEPKQEAPAPTQQKHRKNQSLPFRKQQKNQQLQLKSHHKKPLHPVQEQPQETVAPPAEQKQEIAQPPAEQKPEAYRKQNLPKSHASQELSDLENIKTEVKNGNIIILRVTPLARKSIEDVKTAVNDLFQFAESIGGDIARLGEERVVICPKTIRIWREKSPAPVSSESLPTSA